VTLHFIHIGKTGGSAIKHILRRSGRAHWPTKPPDGIPETPYGHIQLHPHRYKLKDVPQGEYAFFCLRDPIDRFFSAWYSRATEGRPRYYFPWSDGERHAYEQYPTPQALVGALASADEETHAHAKRAMNSIQHVSPMVRRLAPPEKLEPQLDRIVYIAKQETLDQDWENIKVLLQLPPRLWLPKGFAAHKRDAPPDKSLDRGGREALQRYYARDYKLVRYCDQVRIDRGWAPPPPKLGLLRRLVRG
jgi:hypothetical protein